MCEPHVIDVQTVLLGFGEGGLIEAVEDYLHWIGSVAEARWATAGVCDLPWWAPANHVDEIAIADQHPEAEKFDGQRLSEERAQLDISEFVKRCESISGYSLDELAARQSRRNDLSAMKMVHSERGTRSHPISTD